MLAGAIYASLPGQQDKAAQRCRVFLQMAPNHPRGPRVQRHVAISTAVTAVQCTALVAPRVTRARV